MALIKSNGNYIKIKSIRTDNNTVDYDLYQNADVRAREKNNEWTEFDIKQVKSWNTAVINEVVLKSQIIVNYTLEETFKTLCYIAMLCDFSAFDGATLDSDTLTYISSLKKADLTSFTNVVNSLLDSRLTEQADKDIVKAKLAI